MNIQCDAADAIQMARAILLGHSRNEHVRVPDRFHLQTEYPRDFRPEDPYLVCLASLNEFIENVEHGVEKIHNLDYDRVS